MTTDPTAVPTATMLSMPEIAELAEVQRPVVTTWRRRHQSFPAPVAHRAGQPLFDGTAVADWLLASGLGNARPEDVRADLAFRGLVAHVDPADPLRTIDRLGALICLYHQAEDYVPAGEVLAVAREFDPEDAFFLREMEAASRAGELERLSLLAEQLVEAAQSERAGYERLLAARGRLGLTLLTADAPAPELLDLLVHLADPAARASVGGTMVIADLHARCGDLLAATLRQIPESEGCTVLAADTNPRLARIARRRLLLAGVYVRLLDVAEGRELRDGLGEPDLIITQLPYRAGENRTTAEALTAVERATDLLGTGSTAVVLGPADALVDALPDANAATLRSELLRSGLLDAVIALPGGSLPHRPGYRSALWVLTRGGAPTARGRVLLADLSAKPLTERVCTQLAEDVRLWRTEGWQGARTHEPRFGRLATIAELDRDFGAALAPSGEPLVRLLTEAVRERPALIAEAEARLERVAQRQDDYRRGSGAYRGGVVQRTDAAPARTTVGALVRDGRLRVLPGHRLEQADITAKGHHRVLGAEELTGRRTPGGRLIDRLALAARYERVALTEPGDLLCTLVPELGTYVDREGFGVPLFPARVLRVTRKPGEALTGRVLAVLLAAAPGGARSPSAVRAARRIEDWPLPDLDAAELPRLDALLAEAERREELLRAQAEALAEARSLTVAGIVDGTLTLEL